MKKILLIAHLFVWAGLVPYTAHAQEFNAHAEQALSTQISTLRNMLTSTIGSLKETLHKYEVCSAKQMLYAPDAEGADSDGCLSISPQFTDCHERAGGYGVHVYCAKDQVVTKVCGAGRDPDCIAPAGALMTSGSVTRDGWKGPKEETLLTKPTKVFTVITCCSLK